MPSATQPAEGVATLVMTPGTTGRDVMDRVSEAEQVCALEAYGELVYEIILVTPLLLAASDISAGAPLFVCLEPENLVRLGIAFVAALSGDEWSAETVACMIDFGLEHPDSVLLALGVPQGEEGGAAAPERPYFMEFYGCMTDQEKADYVLDYQQLADGLTSAERDLIGAIPETDAACIRDALSDEEYNALLAGTVREAVAASDAVADCISDEGYARAFVSVTEATNGPLSDGTRSCLGEVAEARPRFTALIHAPAYDPSAADAAATPTSRAAA